MNELLKSYGGLSYGQNGSHFEPRTVPPPLSKKCDWEIDPTELDFSNSVMIGMGSFGEILKTCWRGTPVAIKRIHPNLSDDQLVIQDFRHEYLKGKGALSPSTAVNFALDIARNVLLVNSSADHLKVGDFGLSKLIRVQNSHDVYKMTGETGSYRYMAPEVFKHRKYDKKVDVFTFAMILYEMLEGDPPLSHYEPYEAAKFVAEGHRPMFKVKGLTPELKELVEECWAKDVNKRPSFLEILKTLEKIKQVLTSDNHWNIFT
ncbi:putative dual specificity protein kinase splA-like isoform X2 [Capsicum annuum]|nr:putative dual specificity protein kinase splA-like isoform X2 [Capsicum annuum]